MTMHRNCRALLLLAISLIAVHIGQGLAQVASAPKGEEPLATPASETQRKQDERRLYQAQELITALSSTWVFKPGETPRIVWRDVETVQRLGGDTRLRVRWFDAKLNEFPTPNNSGRWLAWIEGTAPNGTPFRRGLTFYGLPKDFLPTAYVPDLTVTLPHFPGPKAPAVLQEHQAEVFRLANATLAWALNSPPR